MRFTEKTALISLLISSLVQPALANDGDIFRCLPKSDYINLDASQSYLDGDVHYNNFMVSEKIIHITAEKYARVLNISFSAINRTKKPVLVSGQFVGRSKSDEITFALVANSQKPMIAAESSEIVQGVAVLDDKAFLAIDSICFSIFGNQ